MRAIGFAPSPAPAPAPAPPKDFKAAFADFMRATEHMMIAFHAERSAMDAANSLPPAAVKYIMAAHGA